MVGITGIALSVVTILQVLVFTSNVRIYMSVFFESMKCIKVELNIICTYTYIF